MFGCISYNENPDFESDLLSLYVYASIVFSIVKKIQTPTLLFMSIYMLHLCFFLQWEFQLRHYFYVYIYTSIAFTIMKNSDSDTIFMSIYTSIAFTVMKILTPTLFFMSINALVAFHVGKIPTLTLLSMSIYIYIFFDCIFYSL